MATAAALRKADEDNSSLFSSEPNFGQQFFSLFPLSFYFSASAREQSVYDILYHRIMRKQIEILKDESEILLDLFFSCALGE